MCTVLSSWIKPIQICTIKFFYIALREEFKNSCLVSLNNHIYSAKNRASQQEMMPVYQEWYLDWLIRQQCQMVGIPSPESKIKIVQITTLNDSNILKRFSCIKINPASSCTFVWFAYINVAQGSSWFALHCAVEKANI